MNKIDPRIGRSLADLDTPTLLLDRAASDRILAKMAAFFRDEDCVRVHLIIRRIGISPTKSQDT